MPRASLHPRMKNCESYDVNITQTTEEDLLNHLKKASEEYEERWQAHYDKLHLVVERQHDHNPYRKCNWRKGSPERKYEKGWEWNQWHHEDTAGRDHYHWLFRIRHDLVLCNREFKWSDNKELEKWYSEFDYFTERCLNTINSTEEELRWIDCMNYGSAKKAWEEEDAEWIELQKMKKEHNFHKPKQYYINLFARDKQAQAWYEARGGIPNHEETCELCKQEKKELELREEQERAYIQEQQQEEQRLKAEREAKQARAAKVSCKQYHCEDCDFHTTIKFAYDDHLLSREHIKCIHAKKWHCIACNFHARSDPEYQHHLTTKKHQSGGIKQTEWRCEACDYTATQKGHYETHCRSKKHLQKCEQK